MTDTTEGSLLERIRIIVAKILEVPPKEVTNDLGAYGHPKWDSLAQMDIILKLEDEFGLTVDDAMAKRLTTVAHIAEQVGAAA